MSRTQQTDIKQRKTQPEAVYRAYFKLAALLARQSIQIRTSIN